LNLRRPLEQFVDIGGQTRLQARCCGSTCHSASIRQIAVSSMSPVSSHRRGATPAKRGSIGSSSHREACTCRPRTPPVRSSAAKCPHMGCHQGRERRKTGRRVAHHAWLGAARAALASRAADVRDGGKAHRARIALKCAPAVGAHISVCLSQEARDGQRLAQRVVRRFGGAPDAWPAA
jgi:hypothetical protein